MIANDESTLRAVSFGLRLLVWLSVLADIVCVVARSSMRGVVVCLPLTVSLCVAVAVVVHVLDKDERSLKSQGHL